MALLVSMKFWRDTKRSPYFFMRQQAAKKMQSYLSVAVVLLLLGTGVGVYGWRTPTDTTLRMALLTNTKPVKDDIIELMAQTPAVNSTAERETMASAQSGGVANLLLNSNEAAALSPELPAAYDRFEPTAELLPTTNLGTVVLSSDVTEEYQAISPANLFGEGFYTLYATFEYKDMVDGLEWAWVWRHNGKVIDGGNELWAYGDEGPGYIFLRPEEGFLEGQYSVEVWVNGEMLGQAAATMNDAAISAGN